MKFRIVSWNMNHWQNKAKSEQAWAYLDALQPDIAILQECVPPLGRNVVYKQGGISRSRQWGSAVVSHGSKIKEIQSVKSRYSAKQIALLQTHPGCVAIAEVYPKNIDPITVVSVYGLIDRGYAITTVHRILSDLTPLIDSPLGKRLVLGGDLNLSTQLPSPDRERHRNTFERIKGLGLADLLASTANSRSTAADCPCEDTQCTHVQTHKHSQSDAPWQNDYIFATRPLAKSVSAAYVIADGDPDPWSLSDHCPVVAEFRL